MIHSHILEFLANLEKQHDVTIVYAAEAGSRALGLNSECSDYDLRFVFKHNERNKYLSLYQPAEVISGFHSSDENVYDYQGWDIKKALCLLQSHNVALLEWIYSPGVYINEYDFCARAVHMVDSEQRRIPIVFHYASMCKKNCEALVACDNNSGQDIQEEVKVKKYLHTVRAACMVEWQFREAGCKAPTYHTLRLPLEDVLSDLEGFISPEVMDKIHGLVEMKKACVEMCHLVPILDEFILAHHTGAAFTSRVMEVLGPENDRYNNGKKKQHANVQENAASAGSMKEKCEELLFHILGK